MDSKFGLRLVHVDIADMKVASHNNILRTILGSCVGVCLYDNITKIGGMAHIMLPSENSIGPPGRYADKAIPILVQEMVSLGAQQERIVAKIAGGAKMFMLPKGSKMSAIGENNIKKVKEVLSSMNIALISEDVGGGYSRTINFFLDTGDVKIRSFGLPDKTI